MITDFGTARRFAAVNYPIPGLLCLAEIGDAEGWGDALLRKIEHSLHPWHDGPSWGMSVGGWVCDGKTLIDEVSLSQSPAFEDAKVIAVGEGALRTWDLLRDSWVGMTR